MSDKLQHTLANASLVAAIITSGLLAGVYFAYASSVMLALGQSDDRTFVEVMNRVNVVILNPWFMLSFLGSVVFSGAAALLHLRGDLRPAFGWLVAAVVLNLISLVITAGFNVPLNDQLATATSSSDFAALRASFENSWFGWNIARTIANTAAVGTLAWGALRR